MNRTPWVIGTAIVVLIASAAPAGLCYLWVSAKNPEWGGLWFLLAATFGAAAGFVASVSVMLVVASRARRQSGESMIGAAGIGIGLAAVVAIITVVSVTAPFIGDARVTQDNMDRADDEITQILTDFHPFLSSPAPAPYSRFGRFNGCGGRDNQSRTRMFVLTDSADQMEHVFNQLQSEAWDVEFRRFQGPVGLSELWFIDAFRDDLYLRATAALLPDQNELEIQLVVGECVTELGTTLAAAEPLGGMELGSEFADPEFPGTGRTALPASWWVPVRLDKAYVGFCDDTSTQSGEAESPRLTDQATDPHTTVMDFIADLELAFMAEGWNVDVRTNRQTDSPVFAPVERRTLRAHKGEILLQVQAAISTADDQTSTAHITSLMYGGTCIAREGLKLPTLDESFVPVDDARSFTPLTDLGD